jgi:predicted ribosomally synthesized peptide with nif11-like leader
LPERGDGLRSIAVALLAAHDVARGSARQSFLELWRCDVSGSDAVAFLERAESDESFAKQLEAVAEDPQAVLEKLRTAGFDATAEEIREAFLERYGADLTPEQLEQVAAGSDAGDFGVASWALGVGSIVTIGAAAAGMG